MEDIYLRELILKNIDDQDKKKQTLEKERIEVHVAYHRYQEAYDEFKKAMDVKISTGHEIQLALSALLEAERALGQQSEKVVSNPETEQQIDAYLEKLNIIQKKYIKMQEEEFFGDMIQEDMAVELRDLAGEIEEADDTIDYLVKRLFSETVDLDEHN